MKQWHVVYTHPREEAVAAEQLGRQEFEVYWPVYRKTVSHARRRVERAASLFPRYLFVAFDPCSTGWRTIRSTRGVVDLIRNGFDPIAVPESLVTAIRAREDTEGRVVLGRQINLVKGQRFKLNDPAFEGQELIFDCQKDADRVVALMSLLNGESRSWCRWRGSFRRGWLKVARSGGVLHPSLRSSVPTTRPAHTPQFTFVPPLC